MTEALISILMILTSTAQIDATTPTGLWYEEFAVPYEIFMEEGINVTIASIKGGQVPLDPRSIAELSDEERQSAAWKALEHTVTLSDLSAAEFDAIFFPGGHGTMFDFPENEDIHQTIREVFVERDGIVAAVCHGPAALVGATDSDGNSIVDGRRLTGFTNAEETAVKLDEHMPFLLESKLRELGAEFIPGENFQVNVIVDDNLITGQNPASSRGAAEAVVKALHARTAGQ